MLEDCNLMAQHRSLDKYRLIVAFLHDVSRHHGAVFNYRSLQLTLGKISSRLSSEGDGFLEKSLPRLAKALDKALAGDTPLSASKLRFAAQPGSELPRFLGEFFNRVLARDGTCLPDPCINCIKVLRMILYKFYKYESPYTAECEQQVVSSFIKAEGDLLTSDAALDKIDAVLGDARSLRRGFPLTRTESVVRKARRSLSDLFAFFDPTDIDPKHGPGAVATRQQPWEKYWWTNVSQSIINKYPLEEFFYSSLGQLCDQSSCFDRMTHESLPARVCLVPKDSRGPRLISCEPVDFQWVQQGLGAAIVKLVEGHVLTKDAVHFTNQRYNQAGALIGSWNGLYATLDLKEASDRVSLRLVRLLFPPHISEYLEACRSSATELPDGTVLQLRKFAPMGSCLCFPIMALTIWAILSAGAPDAFVTRIPQPGGKPVKVTGSILVYGDDVIVPTEFAGDAIELLESFGLKVNRDKSCIKGSFRESCGADAFKGVDVTPIRIRTAWSSAPSAETYTSWVAYANAYWNMGYYDTYDYIVGLLADSYSPLATKDLNLSCPSLPYVPDNARGPRVRNYTPSDPAKPAYQRLEYKVLCVKSPVEVHTLNGWSMLLRWFAEHANKANRANTVREDTVDYSTRLPLSMGIHLIDDAPSMSVSSYTHRGTSILVQKWCAPTNVRKEETRLPDLVRGRSLTCSECRKCTTLCSDEG
jgi:hypothetical protein